MKVVGNISRSFWDEVAARCETATFFHTYEWAAAISESLDNLTIETKGFLLNDGKRAVLPLIATKQRKRGNLKARWSTFPMVYGGPIAEREMQPKEAAAIALSAIHLLYRATYIVDNPFAQHRLPRPYHRQPMFTQWLDLAPGFEAIWRGFSKGHKSSAQRAMRLGVQVRIADSLDDYRAYYSVYEDTLARWGERASSVYPFQLFARLYQLQSPNVRLWLADYKGETIAGALVFYHNHHAVWWHGAALANRFDLYPNNLLQVEIIRDACEREYAYYDFNPSGGHEGVVRFKQSFGAKKLDFSCFSWTNPLYSLYRHIRQSPTETGDA